MTGKPSSAPPPTPLAARSRAHRRRRREGLILVPVEVSAWRHMPALHALGLLPVSDPVAATIADVTGSEYVELDPPSKPDLARAIGSLLDAAPALANVLRALAGHADGDGPDWGEPP
jgi:hypothetical protein